MVSTVIPTRDISSNPTLAAHSMSSNPNCPTCALLCKRFVHDDEVKCLYELANLFMISRLTISRLPYVHNALTMHHVAETNQDPLLKLFCPSFFLR